MSENKNKIAGIGELFADLKEKRPLIHCITNPISINQCANAILALGARPMMAEHPLEAPVITRTAGALMLNLGNLSDTRVTSMKLGLEAAREEGVKVCLDVCGAACLENRRTLAHDLIKEFAPEIVKGNYSEIMALARGDYRSSGVDADGRLGEEDVLKIAPQLADSLGVTILASGKTDIVSDGTRTCLVKNGTPQLSQVVGTGCMQGAIAATFLSCRGGFDAAADAALTLGICAELAATRKGLGTFAVRLMDKLSVITAGDIKKHADLTYVSIK